MENRVKLYLTHSFLYTYVSSFTVKIATIFWIKHLIPIPHTVYSKDYESQGGKIGYFRSGSCQVDSYMRYESRVIIFSRWYNS